MRIADMNWMQVEDYLKRNDRCVLPLGSTEQHAQLSLCVDAILSERVSIEAAEPLGVPVYPGHAVRACTLLLRLSGQHVAESRNADGGISRPHRLCPKVWVPPSFDRQRTRR